MWELWPILLAGAIIVYLLLRYRETFVIKYGNPFDDEDLISFDPEAKGNKLISFTPDSCYAPKSEYQDGLCYEPCEDGYNGIGPVCWADTVNIGTGKPVGLEPCNPGWENWGMVCHEPLRWNSCKFRGLFNECWGGAEGGRIQGRLNGGGICDHPDKGNLPDWLVDKSDPKNYIALYPDKVDGLCYKKCPADKPDRVPGMPYLCYKNSRGLSYGRGVGEAPPIVHFGN